MYQLILHNIAGGEVENLTECEFSWDAKQHELRIKRVFPQNRRIFNCLEKLINSASRIFLPAWCNINSTVSVYYKTARKIHMNDIINFLDDGT